MITVRDSTPSDSEAVARVVASATATLRKTYCPNHKALSHKKKISDDLRRLVAELDGQIVGTTQYLVDDDAIRIIGLGVDSDFRRCGVARALLGAIADLARERNLPSIVTRTILETGNVPVFRALGFELVSEHPDVYSESVTGKPLTEVDLKRQVEPGRRTIPTTPVDRNLVD